MLYFFICFNCYLKHKTFNILFLLFSDVTSVEFHSKTKSLLLFGSHRGNGVVNVNHCGTFIVLSI